MQITQKPKIAWTITGAGHFLKESVELIKKLQNEAEINLYITRAAKEVLTMYGLTQQIEQLTNKTTHEAGHSSPSCGGFADGKYKAFIISPATSNTVAKCALGIADSLATNMFAQAGKSNVPTCVLPTDVEDEMTSQTPNGKQIHIHVRNIDKKRIKELSEIELTTTVKNTTELEKWITETINK